jgi:hypothetical protein
MKKGHTDGVPLNIAWRGTAELVQLLDFGGRVVDQRQTGLVIQL